MLRPRITYANVTATMALVLVLGGTSYAVSRLPANSVGEQQLRRGAVSNGKIRDGAVSRTKLAPDAMLAGPRGPRGPEGAAGAAGPRGPSEAFIARNNAAISLPTTPLLIAEVNLPPGSYALDFTAHAWLLSSSTFVDCGLAVNGAMIAKTAVLVGADPQATIEAVVAMAEAGSWTTDARVRVNCSERGTETSVQMSDARLRAIRVGSVTVQ